MSPATVPSYDLYCAMHAAFRQRHYRLAAVYAEALRLRLTTQPVRLRDWERRIPQIVEVENAARERLRQTNDTTHSQDEELTMPKVSEMNPSKYLKAEDCTDADGDPADLILTITRVEQETVGMGAQADKKWVLYFKEEKKGLVLNKTNTKAIAKIHGDDTDDWEGKRIALYQTEVEYQGDTMLGIRVRLTAPKGKAKKGAPAPLAEVDEDGVPVGEDGKPIF